MVNVHTVLGNQGRAFKRVFALAQKMLREIWGMELRELPVRERVTLQERRQGKYKTDGKNNQRTNWKQQ